MTSDETQKMVQSIVDLPAIKSFQAGVEGATVFAWEELPESQKDFWRKVSSAAINAYPAPLSGEIRIRLPIAGLTPIVRNVRCDVTPESIKEECSQIERWLNEISMGFR